MIYHKNAKYNFLDILKFIMSLCVVGIHVQALENNFFNPYLRFFFSLAVPFFFIASGYMIGIKTNKRTLSHWNESRTYILNYCLYTLKLFIIWILLYIPIDILFSFQSPNKLQFALETLKHLVLFGETTFSWPLWYLYSLVFSTFLIGVFYRYRYSLFFLLILGEIMNFVPYLHEYNRIWHGLAFVCCGIILSIYRFRCNFTIGLILLFLSFALEVFGIPFSTETGSLGLFLIGINLLLPNNHIYNKLRWYSKFIYFTHMYLLFFMWLFSIHGIDLILNNTYYYWIEVSTIMILLAILMNKLSECNSFKFINKLI